MKVLNRKQWLWIGGVAVSVLAIISDLGGTYQVLASIVKALCSLKIYVLWHLLIVSAAIIVAYRAGRQVVRRIERYSADVLSLDNVGQFYQKIQEQIMSACREVVVVGLEKDWVFPLVMSVAIARLRGVAISVGYYQALHERYHLLQMLGCKVVKGEVKTERDCFVGVLSDPNDILNCRATVRTARQSEAIYGRHYFASLDYSIISASRSYLRSGLGFTNDVAQPDREALYQPTLVEVSDEELISRLQAVKFYNKAQIDLQDIQVKDTYPVSSFVVRYKLNQALDIIRLYEEKGWKLFRPTGIRLMNGKVSLIIPPVVEEHSGCLYVADGHSRLYALQANHGHETIRAVVVRKVSADLPINPTLWRKIAVIDEKKEKRDPRLARYIETVAHAGVWGSGNDAVDT